MSNCWYIDIWCITLLEVKYVCLMKGVCHCGRVVMNSFITGDIHSTAQLSYVVTKWGFIAKWDWDTEDGAYKQNRHWVKFTWCKTGAGLLSRFLLLFFSLFSLVFLVCFVVVFFRGGGVQNCQSNGNILHVTFIFDRCRRSLAAVTTVKYKCDLKNLTDTPWDRNFPLRIS